jgi:ribosomal protein S18 acetylase RimI-like enzyme
MSGRTTGRTLPTSLVWATSVDVLPINHLIERRDGFWVVRSPSNSTHYWGNMLVFDDPPAPGDGERWERALAREFGENPRVRHRTFAWDEVSGSLGSAREEFIARGYDLEKSVGLIAAPDELAEHARQNDEVTIRPLDPDGDDQLWDRVTDLWVDSRDMERFHDPVPYRRFSRARLRDLRALFGAGRGAWYVALFPGGELAGSCGIVVTGGRARYQTVDTAEPYRRRGVCSRLVVAAARHAAERHLIDQYVIVADPDYHAMGLYESLGFKQLEHTAGVCLHPPSTQASAS